MTHKEENIFTYVEKMKYLSVTMEDLREGKFRDIVLYD